MGRTAYVAESSERDERGPLAAGTFSAHVEDDDLADGYLAGPDDVPIEQALDWARAHAARVVVRYDAPEGEPQFFSAGSEPLVDDDGTPLPAWPPAGVDLRERRMPGWEFVDRTEADDVIDWDVKVAVHQGWGEPVAGFAERFAQRLAGEPDVDRLDWVAGPGGGYTRESLAQNPVVYAPLDAVGGEAVRARFSLPARTVDESVAAGKSAAQHALDATLSELGIARRGDEPFWWSVRAEAYPAGSRVSAWNARIRAS